jgi:thioredoxin-related protein
MDKGHNSRTIVMSKIFHPIILLLIIACMASAAYANGSSHKLIVTGDLALDGEKSGQTKKPLLLLVSRKGCTYCARIKREILEPMIISGDYDDRIIIRELIVDRSIVIRGFDGKMKNSSVIASTYGVKVTPTLLFLGPDGKELTERIVGINTLGLFSYYVDRAIDEAISKLHTSTNTRQ